MTRSAQRAEFLQDIMITGIETGYCWFEWDRYQIVEDGQVKIMVGEQEGDQPFARCYELNEDESGYDYDKPLTLTLDDVARGLRMFLEALDARVNASGGPHHRAQEYRALYRQADRDNDAGEFDANDCDTIIQYALLGEDRYA